MVAVLATAVAFGACGGSDESGSAPPTSNGSTGGRSATTVAPGSPSRSVGQFCEVNATLNRQMTSAALGLGENPDQIRTFVDELVAASEQAAAAAPPEIAADTTVVTTAVAQFARSLEQTGFDPEKVPADAAGMLSAPEFQAASARLEAFIAEKCPTDR